MADSENFVTVDEEKDQWVEFELFEPTSRRNWPFFPKELIPNMDLFRIGNPIYQNQTDYYYPLLYDGLKLRLQTPVLFVPFNIQTYRNPGSQITKYSLHLSLQTHTPDAKDFKDFLERIDTMVMGLVPLPPDTYFTCIRYNYANPQLPPVMRVKIPNDEDKLKIVIYTDGMTVTDPGIDEALALFQNQCSVKCILEMNPIWVAGGKYGVSYKLIQLTVYQQHNSGPLFR